MSSIVNSRVRAVLRNLERFMEECGYPLRAVVEPTTSICYDQITNDPAFTDGDGELTVHKLRIFAPYVWQQIRAVAHLQTNCGHTGSSQIRLVIYKLCPDGMIRKFEGCVDDHKVDRVNFFGLDQPVEHVDQVSEHTFSVARLQRIHFPSVTQPA